MESQTTEYKQQWNDKYLAYISGFANAQGGTLYIGINDAGEVVGIDNAKYLLENLPNKVIQATGIIPDIEILTKDKEHIAYYQIRYVKNPEPIMIYTSAEYTDTIDGYAPTTTPRLGSLPETTHRQIVEIAAKLAYADYKNS